METRLDALVIGAGIAGLTAARELRSAGLSVCVVERARGIGGRCAVRRISGRPVDFGLPFLHGRDPDFLAVLDAVPATAIEGWPRVREGGGLPCQPEAFQGRDRVLAFREGLNSLAHHLAHGLAIRLDTEVKTLSTGASASMVATLHDGSALTAAAVIMTTPVPHAAPVIEALAATEPVLARWRPVLDQVRYVPCLAAIARYGREVAVPEWDISLPRISSAVHTIVNDTSKRPDGAELVLVLHGAIGYSRAHRSSPPSAWLPGLFAEARRLHGAWIETPVECISHVWEHARVQRPTELSEPAIVELAHGAVVAVCGDAFSTSAGAEGAFLSGRLAARRLIERRAVHH